MVMEWGDFTDASNKPFRVLYVVAPSGRRVGFVAESSDGHIFGHVIDAAGRLVRAVPHCYRWSTGNLERMADEVLTLARKTH